MLAEREGWIERDERMNAPDERRKRGYVKRGEEEVVERRNVMLEICTVELESDVLIRNIDWSDEYDDIMGETVLCVLSTPLPLTM